jgi:Arc/MetJ-type ribon-helix-helix transcriptional regulator
MSDTEKITINISAVDLGKIDLLVQEGMFSNRTDLIRTAIRSQLDKHNVEIQQSIIRHAFGIGMFHYGRKDFEKIKASEKKLVVSIIGMLDLSYDITPQLADEVIESVQVRGIFQASEEVKKVIADRMK